MGIIQTKISIHNSDGWKGQYERMKRWDRRLEKYICPISNANHLHDFLDTLYTTYQNIFHLKDWLYKDNVIDRKTLNDFVNQNKEIGICRDIANGTKHFTVDKNFSIDNNFLIMTAWDPSNEDSYWREKKVRIISKAGLCDPFGLSKKCLALWTLFLQERQLLKSETDLTKHDLTLNTEYYQPNTQTIYGTRL